MQNKTKLIAFHGDPSIKEKYLQRLQFHYNADQIIKGQYWQNGKGCAVGCTVHSGRHDAYDEELGITWRLALLQDSLFEKLPNHEAKEFPIQFLKSIPIGVDTNIIFKKFIIWNLVDEKEGLANIVKDKKERKLLAEVAGVYKRSFTEEIPQSEWKVLADKAYELYTSAYAYAYAYAYASAYAYAYAYASASAYAYAYAYASAYAYAYGSTEWQKKFGERILRMRDKLLELMVAAGTEQNYSTDATKEIIEKFSPVDMVETDVVVKNNKKETSIG